MNLPLLLMQIALILALSRAMGLLFARFKQPQVMGEMVAGIMLGPSLFGMLFPTYSVAIFPAASVPFLNVLSQIGVVFFLFLIGLELDPKLIRNRGHAAVVISHASIIAPFLLGAGLTLFLYPRVFNDTPAMRFSSAALFMGAAMSITAFPVLARILTERNLHKTKVGAISITCAAVDDVTAWCLLAFVVAAVRADREHGMTPAIMTAVYSVVYLGVMFLLIRPFLKRLELVYERSGRVSQNVLAIIFLLTLASAYTTEMIGIHALFGAFLMGAIMPKGTAFVRALSEKLEDYTVVLLLPIFFAYTGLRTQIGVLDHPLLWGYTLLIIAVACLGKFGGSMFAARTTGLGWRESAAIGILMNTRGLMELVILNIGKDLGVISNAVFAMMVIMAIVTTALTTPILQWVYPQAVAEGDAELAAAESKKSRRFSVLVPVSLPASGPPLATIATALAPSVEAPRKIVALNLRRPADRDAYRSGLDEEREAALGPNPLTGLLDRARELNTQVESLTFVSRDVPADIARVGRVKDVDLILMGFHKPVFGQAILGGTVHRVLTASDSDVAIFVDRGSNEKVARILLPYLGGKHDRLAMDLAGRIARNLKAELTVLHVVSPARTPGDPTTDAKVAMEKAYAEPNQPTKVKFEVISDGSPVDAVIARAGAYDLVVIGVEEEWGLESHLFGLRPERIASECPTSLLIVRKHGGLAARRFEREQRHAPTGALPIAPTDPVEPTNPEPTADRPASTTSAAPVNV